MSNPVDDYLEYAEGRPKLASAAGAAGRVVKDIVDPRNLLVAGGQAGLLMGGLALASAVGKAYNAMTKSRDYRAMLDANPDLKDYQRTPDERRQFEMHYNSLRRLNPEFASEPVVAGTYLRQMSMNPQSAGKVVVDSIGGRPPQAASQVGIGPQGVTIQRRF